MYERFTDRARKACQLANQEAQRFNHEYVGTEHLLLGLIKEGSGIAANILRNRGLDLRKIRLEVEKLVQSGPDMVTMGKLPQTPRMKKVIEESMKAARQLNHNYVGTEHLLIGLMREVGGIASQVLINLGVESENAIMETYNLLGHDEGSLMKLERKRLQEKKLDLVSDQDFEGAFKVRDRMDQIDKAIKEGRGAAIEQVSAVLHGYYAHKHDATETLNIIAKIVEDFA